MKLTIKRAKNSKNNWLERAAGEKPHRELQRTQTCGVQAAAEGAKAKLCVPLSSSPPMHRAQGSEWGRITVRIPEKFHLCGIKKKESTCSFLKYFRALLHSCTAGLLGRNVTCLDLAELLGLILHPLLKRAGTTGVQHVPFHTEILRH